MGSNYTPGDMDITAHKSTFSGFMTGTVYGGAAIALSLIYPILVFGTPLGWFAALFTTVVLGFIAGFALKLNMGWFASVIATAIPVAVISWIISVLPIFS